MEPEVLVFTLAGFVSGSLMFSPWLVRLRDRDIRRFGDGNPGAVNAFKAGGWPIGTAAMLLDFLKGAVPVGLAKYVFDVSGLWLVPVAFAPVLGHAFSPFWHWRGGKALAVCFGVWCGLTLWEGPTVFGILMGLVGLFQKTDAWTVVLAMLGLLCYWFVRGTDSVLVTVWCGTFLVLLYKHRSELSRPIQARRWSRKAG